MLRVILRVLVVLTALALRILLGPGPAQAGEPSSCATPAPVQQFLAEGPGTPHAEAPEELQQFGRLVGLWTVETEMATRDGGWVAGAPGIWAWKYTLDGFAVTDLWFQPQDRLPAYMAQLGRDYHLRSSRVFDVAGERWRVSWMANGAGRGPGMDFGTFTARMEGEELVMTSDDTGGMGLQRVVFSDFSDDGFRWRSEFSRDDGKSWTTIMRMRATRSGG